MVSDQTLSSDVWTSVKTLLVAANLATTSGTTPTVVSSPVIAATYNDKTVQRGLVVVSPASVSESEYKFGSTRGHKFINMTIECYGPSTLAVDQLQDQVVHTLSENEISGLQLVGYTSDYSYGGVGDNKFHVKAITFNYDRE
mgnify:CR=1 FL=1